MNNFFKLSSISIATAFILQACSDSEKYQATSNSTDDAIIPNKYVQKDGLSGVVLADTYIEGATVCLDMNSDGICQEYEPNEKTYENGKFSFSKIKTQYGKDAQLLANINDEYILTAPANSSNSVISPFTTITNNEILFNPFANANASDAISDLRSETTLFDVSNLEGTDYLSSNQNIINTDARTLIESFKTAYSLDKGKPLETVANVVDEIIKEKNLSINISSLKDQERVDSIYSLTLDSTNISIDTQDNNQRAIGAKSYNSNTVVHSKWNNRLTLIDSSESKKAVNNYLDGENGDTSSGPSEKILSKMLLNSDSLYSLVTKDKVDNGSDGLGIYRSDFDYNSIPTLKYNSLNTGSNNFFKHDNFSDFTLSNDNNKLLVSSTDNKIYIFDAKDFSSNLSTTVGSSVNAIAYSLDDANYFAAYNNSINVHSSSTNNSISSLSLGKKIKQLLTVNQNELLVSFDTDKEVYLIDTSNINSLSIKRKFVNTININKMNLSPDKKSFALSFLNSKTVTSYLINDNTVSSSIDLLKSINDIIFTQNKRLLAISDFTAYYIDLKGDGATLTDAQKNTWRTEHRR